jgi:hypothetical protein
LSFSLLATVLFVLFLVGHCVVCPLTCWPLCCLSFYLRLLITPLVHLYLQTFLRSNKVIKNSVSYLNK